MTTASSDTRITLDQVGASARSTCGARLRPGIGGTTLTLQGHQTRARTSRIVKAARCHRWLSGSQRRAAPARLQPELSRPRGTRPDRHQLQHRRRSPSAHMPTTGNSQQAPIYSPRRVGRTNPCSFFAA